MRDLERIFELLAKQDPHLGITVTAQIRDAVNVLKRHPLIGRPAEKGRHELVVSRGRSGFVVLYRFHPRLNKVRVSRIRDQRGAGYPDGSI